jgi:hypothetical protein
MIMNDVAMYELALQRKADLYRIAENRRFRRKPSQDQSGTGLRLILRRYLPLPAEDERISRKAASTARTSDN